MAHRAGRPGPPPEGEGAGGLGQNEGRIGKEEELSGAVLGIETATSQGSVALSRGGLLLAELQTRSPGSHSERLLPAVELILNASGLSKDDLAAVAVSIGPGSFTGLRVGLAAAKGLALALEVPLYGIPTLEILAGNAAPQDAPLCAVIDARRGELFSALFRFSGGEPVKIRDERLSDPDDLAAELSPGTLIVGALAPESRKALEARGKAFVVAPARLGYPRAGIAALRGERMLAEGRPSGLRDLVPLYLRPSDAESGSARKRSSRPPARGRKSP